MNDISKFDAMAAWFHFYDGKDHFYMKDGTHVEVDFIDLESIMSNKKYMGEINQILEKRRKFVLSKQGTTFFLQNFIVPINA